MTRPANTVAHPAPPEPRSSSMVTLVGRLGAAVEHRVLPSGDELTTFVVVVDRPPTRGPRRPGPTVDSIACETSRAQIAHRLDGLAPGTWVRAEGVLRRRFWRSSGGPSSVTVVEVGRLTRIRTTRASMGA